MNPQEAICKLISLGWSHATIAESNNTHRANIRRIHICHQDPSYTLGVALVEMARRGRKPTRKTRK